MLLDLIPLKFNTFAIPPFIIGLINLAFALSVYLHNKRSELNRSFALVNFSSGIWLFGFGLLYSSTSPQTALLIAKFLYLGVIFIPATFYHFTARLTSSANKRFVFWQYSISAIFSLILLLSNDQFIGIWQYYWGFQTKAGIVNLPFLIYFHAVFIYCLIHIYKEATARSNSPSIRTRAKYVFWSFSIALFGSLDWLPVYGISYYPLGWLFVIIFSLTSAYAIVNHQLLDIRVVVKRTLIYSIWLLLATVPYICLVLATCVAIFGHLPYSSPARPFGALPTFISIILIAVLFKPLEIFINRHFEKIFFRGTIGQIAAQKELLESELARHDRLKSVGVLAAGMAHEIKNPLTSIRTFAEYLPSKYEDPDFRSTFSRLVVAEVDRINNIVKQLLEFSKPTEPTLKPTLINDVIDDTISLMSNDLVVRNISVARDADLNVSALADANQLKQVFFNILSNSVQSIPGRGTIQINISGESQGYISVQISDSGCGIPPDQVNHIFDPFYTTKEEGTGLGMAIVHSIIQSHGGKIEVDSQVGRGTTITLYLRSASG